MFVIFYNVGVDVERGFSPRAETLIKKYTPGAKYPLTRRFEAVIKTIRELGEGANHNGARWVLLELDDRYKGDNYRICGNDREKTEWVELRENAGCQWVRVVR